MAKQVTVTRLCGPRIKLDNVIEIDELARYTAGRAGLKKGQIQLALNELQGALTHFLLMGKPVRLEGIGIFSPAIDSNGNLKISFKIDKPFLREFNAQRENFTGKIVNEENIGKSVDQLIETWNTEHPDDPVAQ